MSTKSIITVICAVIVVIVMRVLYLIYRIFTTECKLQAASSFKTVVCVGSGGHTSEMLRLMKSIDPTKFSPILYLMADNDHRSEAKILEIANSLTDIKKIPRSRNVQQSYISSVLSTLHATVYVLPILYKFKPHIILCNGPGTCVPVCLIAFMFKCMFLMDTKLVYVESICRVRTLSLTGKILQCIADIFIVQWPQLKDSCLRSAHYGRLT